MSNSLRGVVCDMSSMYTRTKVVSAPMNFVNKDTSHFAEEKPSSMREVWSFRN